MADTEECVVRLAAPVADLAERVRSLESVFRPVLGKWEADVEAFHLLLLSACHASSTAHLARISQSLQPSTFALARVCMECGARALWLLQPDQPFEREARWLAHLHSDASASERLGKALKGPNLRHPLEDVACQIREFASAVEAKLPTNVDRVTQVPNFRSILEAIGNPEKYALYVQLSQITHGTHFATGTFRRNLGSLKQYGEFIRTEDWYFPLSASWWFLATPLLKLGERYNLSREALIPIALELEFSTAQKVLASAKRPKYQSQSAGPTGHSS